MRMKTLYKYTAPQGIAKVFLVERRTFVPPASSSTTFAVILNVKDAVATFDCFSSIEFAAGAFANACDRLGGVTHVGQVEAPQ
jgi:hypothetical protein